MDIARSSEFLFDEATGEPPDPDAIFQPYLPYGTAKVCAVRLMRRSTIGPHDREITQLVLAAGTVLSAEQAAAIEERVQQQGSPDEAEPGG